MAKRRSKKKKSKSWGQIRFSMRIWMRDYTLAISTTLVIISILFIIFGGLALFLYDKNPSALPEPINDWVAFLHGAKKADDPHFDLCMFPSGILMIIFAGYYMADQLFKRSRFNELMETESKSKFMEDLDEAEELAWKISTKHELMVVEKKEELGIRKRKKKR
jgi:hypothetical protein